MISDMLAIRKRLNEMTSQELSRVYMNVFNTDEGQMVLEDLRNRCYAKASTVEHQGNIDPFTVLRNEGMRSVLLHLETQLLPEPEPKTEEVISEQ